MIRAIKITGSIILMSLLPCIQSCYVVDDDDINAICNTDCTTVQGKATTEFGNPVENVSLELYWYSLSGLAVGKARKIATGTTDENGDYNFAFHARDEELADGGFKITFVAPDDTYLAKKDFDEMWFSVTRRDTTIFGDFYIPKRGTTITVKIRNPEAIIRPDVLTCMISYNAGFNHSSNYTAGMLQFSPTSQATFETVGDQPTYLQITKHMNSKNTIHYDTVTIPANETRLVEIEF
jgi:hypothetical protein